MKKITCVDCKNDFYFDDDSVDLTDISNLLNCDVASVLLEESDINNDEKAVKFIAEAFKQFDKNDLKILIRPIRCPDCKKLKYSNDNVFNLK